MSSVMRPSSMPSHESMTTKAKGKDDACLESIAFLEPKFAGQTEGRERSTSSLPLYLCSFSKFVMADNCGSLKITWENHFLLGKSYANIVAAYTLLSFSNNSMSLKCTEEPARQELSWLTTSLFLLLFPWISNTESPIMIIVFFIEDVR